MLPDCTGFLSWGSVFDLCIKCEGRLRMGNMVEGLGLAFLNWHGITEEAPRGLKHFQS